MAVIAFGCGKGDEGLPTVETLNISNINFTSALVAGNVTDAGATAVEVKGICWSTSANPTVDGSRSDNGGGTANFTSAITGLSSNTTYHVRAYAANADGTSYGADMTFTTTAK